MVGFLVFIYAGYRQVHDSAVSSKGSVRDELDVSLMICFRKLTVIPSPRRCAALSVGFLSTVLVRRQLRPIRRNFRGGLLFPMPRRCRASLRRLLRPQRVLHDGLRASVYFGRLTVPLASVSFKDATFPCPMLGCRHGWATHSCFDSCRFRACKEYFPGVMPTLGVAVEN